MVLTAAQHCLSFEQLAPAGLIEISVTVQLYNCTFAPTPSGRYVFLYYASPVGKCCFALVPRYTTVTFYITVTSLGVGAYPYN